MSTPEQPLRRILIANRGEIALRIAATAAEMRIQTVAVFSQDDAASLHVKRCDRAIGLRGTGPRAYLDLGQIILAAKEAGCDAIHPGYGFLSEDPRLAVACEQEHLTFIGPLAAQLTVFGDKASARELARGLGIPIARGTRVGADAQAAADLLASLGAGGLIAIKAVAGGGGRGIRVVDTAEQIEEAMQRCRSEARASFGNDAVYAEEFLSHARHIEVQVVGDGRGAVACLGERECSIQRQRQKLIEIAPAPGLAPRTRNRLYEAAMTMATSQTYRSLGTFEFLVQDDERFVFLEANPRIQVEHTVTEETTGLDLVRLQLRIAAGASLADLGVAGIAERRGQAMQLRVNLEELREDGTVRPSGGRIERFEPPGGPGIRVDSAGYPGLQPNPRFDSLLAKLIVFCGTSRFDDLAHKARRALDAFTITGSTTNKALLQNLLEHPDVLSGRFHTRFVDENLQALIAPREASAEERHRHVTDEHSRVAVQAEVPEGCVEIVSPMSGCVVQVMCDVGGAVPAGAPTFVIEALKMETAVDAPVSGTVRSLTVSSGDIVEQGQVLGYIEPGEVAQARLAADASLSTTVRPDLRQILERREMTLDSARPQAVAARRARGQRTARKNVEDFVDAGSFIEYGRLVVAAQRARRSEEDLVRNTPADGQVCGIGTVNAQLFPGAVNQCVVMAYDFTVLGGSQGHNNHHKTDRMLEIAQREKLPVVIFGEGGGGRSGDTEGSFVHQKTFHLLPRLSGVVPLVGVVSGYCFAGNAAMMGVCDVIIATRNSNIGMGGPAMVEGGGLGRVRATDIGSSAVQAANGVIDILVEDEEAAVAAAKNFLSYRQGALQHWECRDQRELRGIIPVDRRRTYDVRQLLEILADTGSVLELRVGFGQGMVTALARVEGHAVGVIANNPRHLGGAIDRDAADKAARFMRLCDAYGIPMLSLCDTPGIMVGPAAEATGLVRHSARLLLCGANLRVPFGVVVTRKAYGLGKVGMTAGSFKGTSFAVAWPTGEFGAMNFDGAVKLAHGRELEAIAQPEQRAQRQKELVDALHHRGTALSRAMEMECDEVIDPAETRSWVVRTIGARAAGTTRAPTSFIDSW